MKTKKLFSVKKNFSFCKVAIVMSLLVFNGALLKAQVTIGDNNSSFKIPKFVINRVYRCFYIAHFFTLQICLHAEERAFL